MIANTAPRPLAVLLSLPPDGQILRRWRDKMGSARDAPEESDTFEQVYRLLLQQSRVVPADTLRCSQHLTEALAGEGALMRARLQRLQAHALRTLGRFRDADDAYHQAWDEFIALDQREELVRTAIGWTDALAQAGRPQDAVKVASWGRRLVDARDHRSRGVLEANLGNAWFIAGRLDRAVDRYTDAVRMLERTGASVDPAGAAYNLGILHLKRGELPEADSFYQRAETLWRDAGHDVPALYAASGRACVGLARGEWEEGLQALESLKTRFREVGDHRALAQMHREFAALFVSLGALEAAEPEAAAALDLYAELGCDNDAAHMGYLFGSLLTSKERPGEAVAHLDAAAAHWQHSGNTPALQLTRLEKARALLGEGRPDAALEELRAAQRFLDRTDPRGYGALCRALAAESHAAEGRTGLALRLGRRAYDSAKRYPASAWRPRVAMILARTCAQCGDGKQALRWSRRAVVDLEGLLLRFGSRHLRGLTAGARDTLYQDAVRITLEHGGTSGPRRAVDLVARARSPRLIEDLLQGREDLLTPGVRAAIAKLRDDLLSKDSEGAGGTRFRRLQGHVQKLESRLGREERLPTKLIREAFARRGFDAWKDQVTDRDVVLFDQSSDNGWRAWVVSPGARVRSVELPELGKALARQWRPLRITLETAARVPRARRQEFLQKTQRDANAALDGLRRALWDPLRLSGHAVVVPHGELHQLPLEALTLEQQAGASVSRLPHPALLRSQRRARRRQRALLLHGGDDGPRQEVESIGETLRGRGYQVRLGNRRQELESHRQSVDVLHVAGHGIFHPTTWLLSSVKLLDGWIGFEHLHRRHLQGALLYMASCESGLTSAGPGSNVEGWITAGLGAGVREMILTLWKIDDQASVAFADAFYSHWSQGATASVAAQRARSLVRQELPHPYHWAPFIAV